MTLNHSQGHRGHGPFALRIFSVDYTTINLSVAPETASLKTVKTKAAAKEITEKLPFSLPGPQPYREH